MDAIAASKASRRADARAVRRSAAARPFWAASPAASAVSRSRSAFASSERRTPTADSACASSACSPSIVPTNALSRFSICSIRACNFWISPAPCSTVLRKVRSSPRTSAAAVEASLPCTVWNKPCSLRSRSNASSSTCSESLSLMAMVRPRSTSARSSRISAASASNAATTSSAMS